MKTRNNREEVSSSTSSASSSHPPSDLPDSSSNDRPASSQNADYSVTTDTHHDNSRSTDHAITIDSSSSTSAKSKPSKFKYISNLKSQFKLKIPTTSASMIKAATNVDRLIMESNLEDIQLPSDSSTDVRLTQVERLLEVNSHTIPQLFRVAAYANNRACQLNAAWNGLNGTATTSNDSGPTDITDIIEQAVKAAEQRLQAKFSEEVKSLKEQITLLQDQLEEYDQLKNEKEDGSLREVPPLTDWKSESTRSVSSAHLAQEPSEQLKKAISNQIYSTFHRLIGVNYSGKPPVKDENFQDFTKLLPTPTDSGIFIISETSQKVFRPPFDNVDDPRYQNFRQALQFEIQQLFPAVSPYTIVTLIEKYRKNKLRSHNTVNNEQSNHLANQRKVRNRVLGRITTDLNRRKRCWDESPLADHPKAQILQQVILNVHTIQARYSLKDWEDNRSNVDEFKGYVLMQSGDVDVNSYLLRRGLGWLTENVRQLLNFYDTFTDLWHEAQYGDKENVMKASPVTNLPREQWESRQPGDTDLVDLIRQLGNQDLLTHVRKRHMKNSELVSKALRTFKLLHEPPDAYSDRTSSSSKSDTSTSSNRTPTSSPPSSSSQAGKRKAAEDPHCGGRPAKAVKVPNN
ncbi:hypothetical protein V866_003807 [Kwoniella sp. B9012]